MHLKFSNLALNVVAGQPFMCGYWTERGGRDKILRITTLEIIISSTYEAPKEELESEQISQSISNPGEQTP